jgi:hypothetical protein
MLHTYKELQVVTTHWERRIDCKIRAPPHIATRVASVQPVASMLHSATRVASVHLHFSTHLLQSACVFVLLCCVSSFRISVLKL